MYSQQEGISSRMVLIGVVVLIAAMFIIYFFASSQKTGSPAPSSQNETQETQTAGGYNGAKIAGNPSPYLSFTRADYEKALAEGKIIFLDFYANWCPICRGEAPEIEGGFDELVTDQVVGFRVNFNDSETDADEEALAKQFDIPYQHHKVIIKQGQVVLKNGEVWTRERFSEEIGKVL